MLKKGTIQFQPPLPSQKQNAIQNIEVGVYEIIVLEYEDAFWLDGRKESQEIEPDWIEMGSCVETDHEPLFLVNYHKYFKKPILLVHLWGQQARSWCTLSEPEIKKKMGRIMTRTFGAEAQEPKWMCFSKWHLEEDILTSFSAMKQGCSPYDFDRLAQPEYDETCFFGGEATYHQKFGTVSAAYLSGLLQANKILQKIQNRWSNWKTIEHPHKETILQGFKN